MCRKSVKSHHHPVSIASENNSHDKVKKAGHRSGLFPFFATIALNGNNYKDNTEGCLVYVLCSSISYPTPTVDKAFIYAQHISLTFTAIQPFASPLQASRIRGNYLFIAPQDIRTNVAVQTHSVNENVSVFCLQKMENFFGPKIEWKKETILTFFPLYLVKTILSSYWVSVSSPRGPNTHDTTFIFIIVFHYRRHWCYCCCCYFSQVINSFSQ